MTREKNLDECMYGIAEVVRGTQFMILYQIGEMTVLIFY